MTLITPDGSGQPVEDILSSAEQYFRSAEKILQDKIHQLETAGGAVDGTTKKSVQDYRDALGMFIRERQKIEERKEKLTGVSAGGRALDFGAARAEVGRRLACLRDAGRTGEVSE